MKSFKPLSLISILPCTEKNEHNGWHLHTEGRILNSVLSTDEEYITHFAKESMTERSNEIDF